MSLFPHFHNIEAFRPATMILFGRLSTISIGSVIGTWCIYNNISFFFSNRISSNQIYKSDKKWKTIHGIKWETKCTCTQGVKIKWKFKRRMAFDSRIDGKNEKGEGTRKIYSYKEPMVWPNDVEWKMLCRINEMLRLWWLAFGQVREWDCCAWIR